MKRSLWILIIATLLSADTYKIGSGVKIPQIPLYVGGYITADYISRNDDYNRLRVDDVALITYGDYKRFSYLGEFEIKEGYGNNNGANIILPVSYTANAGRLLGSQCAQCHGTNGISVTDWDSIAGEGDLESEIFEDDEPIMNAQAHGYTIDEIRSIGDWLRTLKK